MNKYKKLLNNSLYIAAGNFGSKIITILLVPLYTYYLSPTEYGLIDIIMSTSDLILPIISLSIFEATFRFIIDEEFDDIKVFTNTTIISIISIFIIVIIFPVINYNINIGFDLEIILFYLITKILQTQLSQFVRGLKKIKIYVLNGIIMTVSTSILNILFIVQMNKGLSGYFLSLIISNIISIAFLFLTSNASKYFQIKKFEYKLLNNMIRYSIPLIPNAILWWLLSVSNRYVVIFYLGISYNGILSIANKIPSLLSIISSIFGQSWQYSAIEEYHSDSKDEFFSNIFDLYSRILLIAISLILIFIKPVATYFLHPDYYVSWTIMPLMLLGSTFTNLSVFLGTNYIASKNTKGVLWTTIVATVVNIVLSIVLIQILGLIGIGLSTMLSSLVMLLIRVYDTKKYVKIHYNFKAILFNVFLIFVQILIMSMHYNLQMESIMLFIIMMICLFSNRDIINQLKIFKSNKNK